MNFFKAIDYLMRGKKVSRKEWGQSRNWLALASTKKNMTWDDLHLVGGINVCNLNGEIQSWWTPSQYDVIALDWCVLENLKTCDNPLEKCDNVITDEVANHYCNEGQKKQYCITCLMRKDGEGKQMFGRQPMNGFGQDIWDWIKSRNGNVFQHPDSSTVMMIAEKHGLAQLVAYNPAKHGLNCYDKHRPGDEIWWWE